MKEGKQEQEGLRLTKEEQQEHYSDTGYGWSHWRIDELLDAQIVKCQEHKGEEGLLRKKIADYLTSRFGNPKDFPDDECWS